jgi:hypothetical protein
MEVGVVEGHPHKTDACDRSRTYVNEWTRGLAPAVFAVILSTRCAELLHDLLVASH